MEEAIFERIVPLLANEPGATVHVKFIQVSLDSDDGEMMKRIRKAVQVERVFETIQRIREVAARQVTVSWVDATRCSKVVHRNLR